MLIRAGLSGGDTLPHLGELLVLPFTFTYLATLCRAGAFQEVVETAMKPYSLPIRASRQAAIRRSAHCRNRPDRGSVKIHAAGVNL